MELANLPKWAGLLANYYVVLRVQGRNQTLRRRYYRLVEREKLRLAVLGIDQQQIIAVCRYLSGLNKFLNGSERQAQLMHKTQLQLSFEFTY